MRASAGFLGSFFHFCVLTRKLDSRDAGLAAFKEGSSKCRHLFNSVLLEDARIGVSLDL